MKNIFRFICVLGICIGIGWFACAGDGFSFHHLSGSDVYGSDVIQTKDSNVTVSKDKAETLLNLAKSKLGDRYKFAATGPNHFDCSGFVYYVFKENGIQIPRASLEQSKAGEKLERNALKKGDILFFDTSKKGHVNHSGIYLGEGMFIHSSSGKAYGVTISKLDKGFYKDNFRWGIRKLP
ncbi:MAG TPA: NlpC/P60 family protein [Epsilonproteobacteria bacterium]|nr:NlpC/P60 family protein [Campylobacterota bacterium]